jgi:hypothetical protein
MRRAAVVGVLMVATAVVACGGDDTNTGTGGGSTGASGGGSSTGGGEATGGSGTGTGGMGTGGMSMGGAGGGVGGASSVDCDYQAVNEVVVIEAEDLPLAGMWQTDTANAGYTGTGYILWTGSSQNNNPGQGLIAVDLYIPTAGRYHLQWRNRIGMGTNTTEHNDTWLRFAQAGSYYGLKTQNGLESRRYPKPTCDDQNLMSMVAASPDVASAQCPNGSTSDGWLKVYSSGANDWSWSTNTSDNDGHAIFVEFGQSGVYTMELSARADFHLIDRIVLSEENVDNGTAQDLGANPTPCTN